MAGLSRKHHAELNYPPGVKPGRYDELRRQYAGDAEALRQIDIYDPNSEYKAWWRKYRNALKAGNGATEKECEEWFEKHGF